MGREQLKQMTAKDFKAWNYAQRFVCERLVLPSLILLLVAAILTASLISVFENSLSIVEERAGSLPWTLFVDESVEERLTIVAIDEKSISEIGPWPWPRTVMAELVERINAAGSQLQIHDVLYPVGDRQGDAEFLDALLQDQKSIIAQLPVLQIQDPALKSGLLTHSVSGVGCDLGGQGYSFPVTNQFIGASDALVGIPKGHIAPIIETDGSVRKVPAIICSGQAAYPALAISPFFQLTQDSVWEATISPGVGLFESPKSLNLNSFPGLQIPLDIDGGLRISFKKSPASFISVSALDVLQGSFDPSLFDNTLVLVGATAFGLDDIVPTPYSGSSPGVELQARVLSSVLDSKVPYTPRGDTLLVAMVTLLIGAALLTAAIQRGRIALLGLPLLAFTASIFALAIHGVLLNTYEIWIGWLYSGLFGFVGGSLLLISEHARVRFERGLVMQNLTSYLPLETAKKVAYQLPTSAIQAERCEVTLLTADLRNFSALGELRPPEESASVLHYFFTKVSEIVERNGGRVHEYKGDSVLAVWSGDGVESAAKSLSAALDIEQQVNANLLTETQMDGLEPLAVGIGIEQGPVLMGSIGPAHRRAHALCGEAVTVALRIQEMTADLSYPILIGEVAARYLPDAQLRSVGNYLLPGLVNAHTLFTPIDKGNKQREGFKLLKGGLEEKKSADLTG
ncbi:MAG: hypothetical protein CBB92_02750 [Flammeovirgaceae bacterium TMED32]|nr:MAG: hypothetical protein CBB92_02750 [Flammeovirgaceae bacterium TMED32]